VPAVLSAGGLAGRAVFSDEMCYAYRESKERDEEAFKAGVVPAGDKDGMTIPAAGSKRRWEATL